jgi:hypothetical protein
MPIGPGGIEGLEPSEPAVDAVALLRSETAGAVLAGVLSVVVAGEADASVTACAAE